MHNTLEKLDQDLFKPLDASESVLVSGGYQGYTDIGMCICGNEILVDYVVDNY